MAAVDATDWAIEGTVIWANRADGLTALAGLAETVAASGRGGMARPATAAPAAAVAGSGLGRATVFAGAAGDLAATDLVGVFVEVGNRAAFFGVAGVTFDAGVAVLAADLPAVLVAGTVLEADLTGAGGFEAFGEDVTANFLAGAAEPPLVGVFAAVLDAGLLALANSFVWGFTSCLLAAAGRA